MIDPVAFIDVTFTVQMLGRVSYSTTNIGWLGAMIVSLGRVNGVLEYLVAVTAFGSAGSGILGKARNRFGRCLRNGVTGYNVKIANTYDQRHTVSPPTMIRE